jgi:hypothetical protein
VDKDDTSRRLLTPEDRRDLLFRKVLLFHPENLPFLVMTRFKNLTSRMDQETGRTSVAKPDMLSEVVDRQRLTVDFVVSSGVAKSFPLKFLIPGSLVGIQPGVFFYTCSQRCPGSL